MITIPYNTTYRPKNPPIPILDIDLESTCKNPPPPKPLSAIIDTGCDYSIIPDSEAKTLKLIQRGIEYIDFGLGPKKYPRYELRLNVSNVKSLPKCYAVATPTKETILGRNIINYWRIELDGTTTPVPTLTIY